MTRLTEVGLLLLLLLALMLSAEARRKRPQTQRREKREWILPPAKLLENTDYTQREYIAKIRSDKDVNAKVEYYLSGPGADKPPFNLFVVDHDTGFVSITGILDREKYPFFNLTGIAKLADGTTAEDDIPLTVTVLDQNDNAPYFNLHTGNITEASKKGTFVMQIEGKDNDEAGTTNSEIFYSIVSQEPEGTGHMFTIDQKTGKLFVKEPTLDRETYDFYKLVIKGIDLGGAPGGLSGTGTVEITVLDINDNAPTLEKSEYTGAVDENVADVVVMRIKALDKDLEHTENWLTVFTIVKGNEDNLFSIETDKGTNEGILKLIKPVDFEEIQNLELGLLIENIAPLVEGGAVFMDVDVQVGEGSLPATGAGASGVGGMGAEVDLGLDANLNLGVEVEAGVDTALKPEAGLGPELGVKPGAEVGVGLKPGDKPGPGTKPKPHPTAKSYPIKIAVNNVPEGPAFIPDTKTVPVSEDPSAVPEDGVITVFAAVDPDTGKLAEDVSYAKAYDPDNWFTIDEETAEIKLTKVPDRESPFLVNSTYIAKILAITKDMPPMTATGTIAIQVTDSNDHCPTLTTTHSSLCSSEKTVFITGYDEDVSPNAAPFTFRIIPDGTQGSWVVELINETSVALHSQEKLWPGSFELQVVVLDAQGLSCPANEVFTVDVCTCVDTEDCRLKAAKLTTTSSKLSAPAIGLLFMAACLLLFIPLLLLFCQCGGVDTIFPDQFSDLPFDAKEHLISYHTECKGEDKEVPLQCAPIILDTQKKVETAPKFNGILSKITETHQTATLHNESMQMFQEANQSLMAVDNAYGFSRKAFNHGNGSDVHFSRQRLGIQNTLLLYEDIALPDAFLNDYYSQKAVCAVPGKDCLLVYADEEEGSSAGSVGCCSLLDSDNDLQFLNDLGPKFETLADICSPPIPKLSLTAKVAAAGQMPVDISKQVVNPKIEHIVEIKQDNVKTDKLMSSTNISKSFVNTVSTGSPSMTLPHSKVTNISHSASLPCPVQTVLLQQQPVYYTTSPVLQPMHYVVQPQQQNTVLLADGAHGTNFPGVYVISGSQNPSSGITFSGPRSPSGLLIQGIESPKSPASPTSPVSPTLLLPGSPGVFQCPDPVEGWKLMGPNPNGNYMLVKEKSSAGDAVEVDLSSSQGTLPSDASLVNEAAPPQGVLGPAAQGSVYGILPGHTVAKEGNVVAFNRNSGGAWGGQQGQMGLGLITIVGDGVGQSRIGMGHVAAVTPGVFEQCETAVKKPGATTDETAPDQVNKITELSTKKYTDVISLATEFGVPQENAEEANALQSEQKERHAFLPGSDVIDLIVKEEERKETSMCTHEEEATSTADHLNNVDDQVHSVTEESGDRQEAAPLKEEEEEEEEEGKPFQLSKECLDNQSCEEGSETESNEFTEDQSERVQEEDFSPAEKVGSDLEANQVITICDCVQAEKHLLEMTTVPIDALDMVKAEQEKLLGTEVGLSMVDDELTAPPSKDILKDTQNESEERVIPDQEPMPELQVCNSEQDNVDKGHAKTDTAEAEGKKTLQKVSTILTYYEKGNLGNLNLKTEEITTQVEAENSNVPTKSTLELTAEHSSCSHKEEEYDDDNQNITTGSGVDLYQMNADTQNISDGVTECLVDNAVSQQSYVMVKEKSSQGDAVGLNPGSSQGTLPSDAILVNEAAPPQGVLGPAAHGSVYGILPGHTVAKEGNVVAFNRNSGGAWGGQQGQMGLGLITIVGDGVGQSRIGMGHVAAVTPGVFEQCETAVKKPGATTDEIAPDQVNKITELSTKKCTDVISLAKEFGVPQENAEEANALQSEQKEKHVLYEDLITQISCTEAFLPGSDVIDLIVKEEEKEETSMCTHEEEATSTADHLNIVDDQVHSVTEESRDRQEAAPLKEEEEEEEEGKPFQLSKECLDNQSCEEGSETESNEFTEDQSEKVQEEDFSPAEKVGSDLEANQVITICDCVQAEKHLLEMTTVPIDALDVAKAEQEKLLGTEVGHSMVDDELTAPPSKGIFRPGATTDETAPDQVNKITELSTKKYTDVISLATEFGVPQENAEEANALQSEQKERHAFLPGSDVIDLIVKEEEREETSMCTHEEEATSTADHLNNVDDQVHSVTEESGDRQEAAPLKEEEEEEEEEEGKPFQLSKECLDNQSCEEGSETESNEFTEDQSERVQEEDFSPAEKVGSDLEANQVITICDCVQAEKHLLEMTTVPIDALDVVKAEQEKLLGTEVGLSMVDDELTAPPSKDILKDTQNESEERVIPDQEPMPELQVCNSEQDNVDKGHAKTDTAKAEGKKTLQKVSTILTYY